MRPSPYSRPYSPTRLGVAVGETLGYLATAAWTLLVIAAPGRSMRAALPKLCRWAGGLAAVAILAGVLEPAGVPAAGLVNFAGYVLWSLWLIAFGVLLIRRNSHLIWNPEREPTSSGTAGEGAA